MNDDQISKVYLISYFWLSLVVKSVLVYFGTELESPRGIINTALTYLAFIPLHGYIYNKQIPTRGLWQLFIGFFFLWQIAGFFILYAHPLKVRLLLLLMMAPFYWALAGYALITTKQNEAKKNALIIKRDAVKEKFKGLVVLAGAMSMLLLMICLSVMLSNYWRHL